MCKRNEGESFTDYRARRTRGREALDAHLRGVPIVRGNGTNRAEVRALADKSIHHGSEDKCACHHVANRRKKGMLRKRRLQHTTALCRSRSPIAEAATAA